MESLEKAKKDFLVLLSRVDPAEASEFVHWVVEQCSGLQGNKNNFTADEFQSSETRFSQEEENLKSIADDLRSRLPLEAICPSENIHWPSDEDQVG